MAHTSKINISINMSRICQIANEQPLMWIWRRSSLPHHEVIHSEIFQSTWEVLKRRIFIIFRCITCYRSSTDECHTISSKRWGDWSCRLWWQRRLRFDMPTWIWSRLSFSCSWNDSMISSIRMIMNVCRYASTRNTVFCILFAIYEIGIPLLTIDNFLRYCSLLQLCINYDRSAYAASWQGLSKVASEGRQISRQSSNNSNVLSSPRNSISSSSLLWIPGRNSVLHNIPINLLSFISKMSDIDSAKSRWKLFRDITGRSTTFL